ncbi:MAG: pyridoxamine 5'-phosphate oxidase family protein [Caulobacterales bacterium]
MVQISDLAALEALYLPAPNAASTVKEVDFLTPEYQRLIAASPLVALASVGPEGVDCSPRGDAGQAVAIADPRTLLLPDRRGNNRIDSLRNIVRDPRIALLFFIPGSGTTMRVNGRASLHDDTDLLARFAVEGAPPRCVIKIVVERAYFQCARAIVRADFWNPERFVDPASLPSAGEMLAALSAGDEGGTAYDAAWPERARKTLW